MRFDIRPALQQKDEDDIETPESLNSENGHDLVSDSRTRGRLERENGRNTQYMWGGTQVPRMPRWSCGMRTWCCCTVLFLSTLGVIVIGAVLAATFVVVDGTSNYTRMKRDGDGAPPPLNPGAVH